MEQKVRNALSDICNEDARQYLMMLQDIINRMASNSSNCKTWLVTIVAAFLAIGCNINDFDYWLLLAIAPICIFWYLDAYYLNLERGLRNREQRFINILKSVKLWDEDESTIKTKEDAIFVFKTLNKNADVKNLGYVKTGCMIFNKSVWPVYVIMLLIVIFVTVIINDTFPICFCNC